LEKRTSSSVWEGLWSIPEIHKDCQPQKWVKDFLGGGAQIELRKGSILATFSHYKMRLFFEHIQIHKPINKVINEKFKWVDKEEIKYIGLPSPIKKLLDGI
jgi:adenine-specific DNA glycosylase